MASSSSTSHQWEHDVFLSFRGVDKRYNFIAHLFKQLEQKSINYFHDRDRKYAGMKTGDMIFGAIHHSRIALVVFSENYANSKWCLNELVKILNCERDRDLVVIPIFLIPHSDVKNLAMGDALNSLVEEERDIKQKEWRGALEKASKIAGFHLLNHANRDEAKLVDIIVKHLDEKIDQIRPLYFVKDAIGVDHMADDVISLLKNGDKKGARMVGICGPEGIGKTTVAGIAFNKIRAKFKYPVFLAKIGEVSERERLKRQKALLQKLGGEERPNYVGALVDEIKRRLHGEKVLLVLDGVTDKKQVEDFGIERPTDKGKQEINDGSRILITTRDRALLNDLKVDDKYIVKGLHQEVARQLFRRHAFKTERPEQDFEELSESLTHYAGGHPLTLKRLGSYVSDKSINHWRKTLDKLVRSASSLSHPLQSVGRYGGRGGGAHDDATHTAVELDYPNEYRAPIGSIGAYLGLSSRAYPFEVVGSFGVVDGTTPWKDEGYTDVREIVVYVGSDPKAIKSISIIYDKCGRPSDRIQHGTTKGGKPYTITLDYPSEYLTTISGYTGKVPGLTTLRSLTIRTNDKKYGPYGTTKGKKFSFPYTGGKIVGFHGSFNGSHLESIGAFYKPIPHTYPVKVFGPFGSEGENSSDFGDIEGIAVRYSEFVKSITFKVNVKGSEPHTSYGGNGGENSFKVKLKEGEYITSFSGYFNVRGNRKLINSLTFRTNKRILGPIGREEGHYFSLPPEAGKVIGFFGRSDNFLESIGARVELYSNKLYPYKSVGLFGWKSGSKWDDGKQHTNVRKINVELDSSGEGFIRSIEFQYEEENKKLSQLEIHRAIDGNELPIVRKEIEMMEMEYLTSISGYMFQPNKETFGLASLTFQTNKRTLKRIGHEKGRHFSSPATGGKIVGFYGWSGEHLKAIGAYFEPISNLYPIKSIGPFGGHLGQRECDRDWNDGQFNGVRNIEVIHYDVILCIKFVYDNGSEQGHLVVHDGRTKEDKAKVTKVNKVALKYPEEYLTSISGYQLDHGDGIDNAIIESLTFHSNKNTYGPFGGKTGKYFWYPSTGSKIFGFFGRCGKTLNSIGVYAQPIPQLCPFKTVRPFGNSDGTVWDDGVHTDVRAVHILATDVIHYIRIVYDNNGSIVEGSEHGKKGRYQYDKQATLDYPKERLRSISGWMKPYRKNSDPIIRDLKIHTTKTVYGPFGTEEWPRDARENITKFRIPLESGGGRIVGFFGRAGSSLNSIGARLEPS